MPETTLQTLIATAAFLGFFHTAVGPDHYLPFIALSRAGGWSLGRTMFVTTACGLGHVASSVLIGLLGLAMGRAAGELIPIESWRGETAGWLLLGVGLAYMVWGLRRASRDHAHTHQHVHADGMIHAHQHAHDTEHAHPHAGEQQTGWMRPWLLFLLFVFGPCEVLIPLLIYPAAMVSTSATLLVSIVFGLTTLATMLTIVALGYYGLSRLDSPFLRRHAHSLCGATIAACGGLICLGL